MTSGAEQTEAGTPTSEFGPEPGATIMWFGSRYRDWRFDHIPIEDRRWFVERSRTNPSPNLLKFKRLNDEYNVWRATQPTPHPTTSTMIRNQSESLPHWETIQSSDNKGGINDIVKVDTKVKSSLAIWPSTDGNFATANRRTNTPALDNRQHTSRSSTIALPSTVVQQEDKHRQQKTPRLKQTTLQFPRTPFGPKIPNIKHGSQATSSTVSKAGTGNIPSRKPLTPGSTSSPKGGKLADLLSTSKVDTSIGQAAGSKVPASKKYLHGNSSDVTPKSASARTPLANPEVERPIPRPVKRRKTAHGTEADISSTQSPTPSPWRPLVYDGRE